MEKKQSNTHKISWSRGKCLGKGSFGTVSLAINESNGEVFAVKSVDVATCFPKQLESLENEIRILRSLSSPYVVEYLGDDVTRYDQFSTTTSSYRNLHMEYLPGGTVADMAIVRLRLADDVSSEEILRWHTWCLVSALKYVHGEGIVHCDVKGKNVLVGPDLTSVKLADFGSAIEINKKESAGDSCKSTITPRGSPLWMAPEVIRGECLGPESDVWSLGCTVIEMVTGKPAWEDQGFNSLSRIANSDELPELPIQLSELGKDFVEKCLRRDRYQRWSCDQLLQHPFVASASPPNMIGESSSPRCVLSFAGSDFEDDENTENFEVSARERIDKLATEGGANWESDGWVSVRSYVREPGLDFEEGTSTEYPELMMTEKETEGTSSVYSASLKTIRQGIERTNLEIFECFDGNYMGVRGLKSSSGGLRCCGGWRCECWAGSSCRYGCGSQKVELTVGKRVFRFYRFWNLLQLYLCNLRIFTYILLQLFYYLFFTFVSQPQFPVMRFRPFLFRFYLKKKRGK